MPDRNPLWPWGRPRGRTLDDIVTDLPPAPLNPRPVRRPPPGPSGMSPGPNTRVAITDTDGQVVYLRRGAITGLIPRKITLDEHGRGLETPIWGTEIHSEGMPVVLVSLPSTEVDAILRSPARPTERP